MLLSFLQTCPERGFEPVEGRLQEISFSGVLRVEKFKKLKHELLVDELLGHGRLKIRRFQAPAKQEKRGRKEK